MTVADLVNALFSHAADVEKVYAVLERLSTRELADIRCEIENIIASRTE